VSARLQGGLYMLIFHCSNSNTPLGWHSDNEPLHGSIEDPYAILSLSMGTSRTFSIRPMHRRNDETHFLMNHGDLLSMNGLFQKLYQHR
jgi:alkylated DNA repair dioxygenase AlkB